MERNVIRLGVNIDHVATLRQVRRALEPDPVAAAALAILGGADNITLHLREDRRHIQERDLRLLSGLCARSKETASAASHPGIAEGGCPARARLLKARHCRCPVQTHVASAVSSGPAIGTPMILPW